MKGNALQVTYYAQKKGDGENITISRPTKSAESVQKGLKFNNWEKRKKEKKI